MRAPAVLIASLLAAQPARTLRPAAAIFTPALSFGASTAPPTRVLGPSPSQARAHPWPWPHAAVCWAASRSCMLHQLPSRVT
jgi:hypothetical protein